jgi:hypothetical protein
VSKEREQAESLGAARVRPRRERKRARAESLKARVGRELRGLAGRGQKGNRPRVQNTS